MCDFGAIGQPKKVDKSADIVTSSYTITTLLMLYTGDTGTSMHTCENQRGSDHNRAARRFRQQKCASPSKPRISGTDRLVPRSDVATTTLLQCNRVRGVVQLSRNSAAAASDRYCVRAARTVSKEKQNDMEYETRSKAENGVGRARFEGQRMRQDVYVYA